MTFLKFEVTNKDQVFDIKYCIEVMLYEDKERNKRFKESIILDERLPKKGYKIRNFSSKFKEEKIDEISEIKSFSLKVTMIEESVGNKIGNFFNISDLAWSLFWDF